MSSIGRLKALMTSNRSKKILTIVFLGFLSIPSATWAIPEQDVISKLDSILILFSVNAQGSPLAVRATVNGKTANAYIAAMSITGAQEVVSGKRYEVKKEDATKLRFAPVSLAKYYQLLQPLLKADPSSIGVIAPDPEQISAAEKLLINQLIPAEKAKKIANSQPMVFCPEPGLLVSLKGESARGNSFVPCATEAQFVDSIVQRAIKESPPLSKKNLRVIAIPLDTFVAFLRKESPAQAAAIQVIPSAQLTRLVQQSLTIKSEKNSVAR